MERVIDAGLLGDAGLGGRELALTPRCRDVLAGHLGGDPAVVAEIAAATTVGGSYASMLASGLYFLLVNDLGTVDEWLEDSRAPSTLVEPARSAAARRGLAGESGVGRVLYDRVVDAIAESVLRDDRVSPAFAWWSDTLYVPGTVDAEASAWRGAGVLIHEVTHEDAFLEHVDCGDPSVGLAFDDAWEGPYGAEAFFMLRLRDLEPESRWFSLAVSDAAEDFCSGTETPLSGGT